MEIVELSTRLEGTDTEHYNKAADYWQSVTPTINGMLGEITILNLMLSRYSKLSTTILGLVEICQLRNALTKD